MSKHLQFIAQVWPEVSAHWSGHGHRIGLSSCNRRSRWSDKECQRDAAGRATRTWNRKTTRTGEHVENAHAAACSASPSAATSCLCRLRQLHGASGLSSGFQILSFNFGCDTLHTRHHLEKRGLCRSCQSLGVRILVPSWRAARSVRRTARASRFRPNISSRPRGRLTSLQIYVSLRNRRASKVVCPRRPGCPCASTRQAVSAAVESKHGSPDRAERAVLRYHHGAL